MTSVLPRALGDAATLDATFCASVNLRHVLRVRRVARRVLRASGANNALNVAHATRGHVPRGRRGVPLRRDTKKAQRWFKERRIKFQFIDLKEKEMSKGELRSVCQATGGIDAVLDPKAKDEDTLALVQNLAESQRFDKLLENQQLLREPIVRNGRAATVGYAPEVWGTWE